MTITRTPTHVRMFPPHGKVVEDPEEYVVELDVSEFTQPQLKVSVDGDVVTVTGDQEADRTKGEALVLSERLEESFRIPADGRVDDLSVNFDDGKCELHITRHRFRINPDADALLTGSTR